ncbi:MAG: hypothetical protein IJW36_02060 [Clostridia bacterium]|nr:hypothetical protein [Clostridia bacterium]
MLKNLKIDNDKLLFENKKGYYSFDLSAIDVIDYFGFSLNFKFFNGRIYVANYDDRKHLERDFQKLVKLLSAENEFCQCDENIIINLSNVNEISTRIDDDGINCNLVLQFENFKREIAFPDAEDVQKAKQKVERSLEDLNNINSQVQQ